MTTSRQKFKNEKNEQHNKNGWFVQKTKIVHIPGTQFLFSVIIGEKKPT